MSFGKGIPLATNFDLGAKSPLDSRIIVNTIEERDRHVKLNRVYEGMLVYVVKEKKLYRYENQAWKVIPTTEDIPTKISDLINDKGYVTKDEFDEVLKDIDLEDCWYLGDVVPENNEMIWFSGSASMQSDFTYDNPIIQELFASIQSLQKAVSKLQADVEYIKIHGGGNGGSDDNDDTDTTDISSLELEDGGLFLLEDGSLLLLENAIQEISDTLLLLENGAEFLLEDGSSIRLEKTDETEPHILIEDGSDLLLENNGNIILE